MAARLFVLLARQAPIAVVFRRGPSKRVALLRWSTGTDQFETDRGQPARWLTALALWRKGEAWSGGLFA